MKSNNELEAEALDITSKITTELKLDGYFEQYSGIDENIFKKYLNIFILEKLNDSDENELIILDEDLYKISTDAAQESIEILVNKTIMEKQEEIEKLIQSAQINTNGVQQNRRRNKKNV
jgi:hypothetical protein